MISAYDVVADGSDNFATRYLVNDACFFAQKPLVSAAIMRFDGQITTFKAHARGPDDPTAHPCQRCIFPSQPEDPKQGCADMGVMGALAGTLGAMQANEVIKELLGIGESLSGRLMLVRFPGQRTFRRSEGCRPIPPARSAVSPGEPAAPWKTSTTATTRTCAA